VRIACTYSFMNRSLERDTMRALGRFASCWWPIECSRCLAEPDAAA
jgi:hypothetical protein